MRLVSLLLLGIVLGQGGHYPENPKAGTSDDVPLSEEEREENYKTFNSDWEKYMLDFDFTDMLNFEVYAGGKSIFNEKVEKVPMLFRGVYAVAADDSYQLAFNMYDPSGKVIVSKKRFKDAIIYVQLNKTGTYTLEFSNNNVILHLIVVLHYGRSELLFSAKRFR